MTLPAGQISMSQVNTELGRSASAQIDLGGTNPSTTIRSLFGVASGQIGMSSGHSKSSIMGIRPSTNAVTGIATPGTPANAYDSGTGTTVDTSTNTGSILVGLAIPSKTGNVTYSGFAGGTSKSGTLHIYASSTTADMESGDLSNEAYSTVTVDYYNGSTWINLLSATSGLDDFSGDHTFAITVVPSTLQVRFTLTSMQFGGLVMARATANASTIISDIVFVA